MEQVIYISLLGVALYLLKDLSFVRGRFEHVFLFVNVLFVTLNYQPTQLLFLGCFLLICFAFISVKRTFQQIPLWALLSCMILVFCIAKNYAFLPLGSLHAHIPEVIGLSYIIFRTINMLYEANDSRTQISFLSFLSYTTSIFTLLSGPIQRYNQFAADMKAIGSFHPAEAEAKQCFNRCANGFVKVILIAPIIQSLQLFLYSVGNSATATNVLGNATEAVGTVSSSLFYLFFLYFNFSGYTDIVISIARLCGFNLPENFNRPFSSTSFLDFWNHWHISLSSWFRDYCYTPFLMAIMKRGGRSPLWSPAPALFLSFGLLGVWHGRTWPFLLCGFMLAIGAVLNNTFRVGMKQLVPTIYKRLASNLAYQSLCSSLTFFYIALAISGLWLSGAEMVDRYSEMSYIVPVCLVLILVQAIAILILRGIGSVGIMKTVLAGTLRTFRDNTSYHSISLKIIILAIWYFVSLSQVPDFVYKGF